MKAAGYSLCDWKYSLDIGIYIFLGGCWASPHDLEEISINKVPTLLFSGFRLEKLSCIFSHRAWHENGLCRTEAELLQVCKFSLLLSLIFHQVRCTSTFFVNYLLDSLKQNTHGYGFVLHQVCLIFLLFGTNSDFICTLQVCDNAETKERKGLQWVCW